MYPGLAVQNMSMKSSAHLSKWLCCDWPVAVIESLNLTLVTTPKPNPNLSTTIKLWKAQWRGITVYSNPRKIPRKRTKHLPYPWYTMHTHSDYFSIRVNGLLGLSRVGVLGKFECAESPFIFFITEDMIKWTAYLKSCLVKSTVYLLFILSPFTW